MGWKYNLRDLALITGGTSTDDAVEFDSVSTDTRNLEKGDLFFALSGDNFDGNRFVRDAIQKGACAAVTTEAHADGPCVVAPDTLKALQDFAAYHRSQYDMPIIAITGSCGKTTSKDMAHAVLNSKYRVVKTRGNLNNHIGCPLSLLSLDDTTELAVIEMGANHIGEIAGLCELAQPTEAAITMVAPSHLEGFGSIENVAHAKAEIIKGLQEKDVLYVNNDDEWCRKIAEPFSGEKVRFGMTGDIILKECRFDDSGEMFLNIAPIGEMLLPLYCKAHVTNVLLAIAIGLKHGITEFEKPLRAACVSGSRFKISHIGGLEIIDDTYNANPASMAAAIETLVSRKGNGSRIAALGEMLELGDDASNLHRKIGAMAADSGITHLFAMGPHACDMISAAKEANLASARVIQDHGEMAKDIFKIAEPGDMLLLKGSRGMQMECIVDELKFLYCDQEKSDRK